MQAFGTGFVVVNLYTDTGFVVLNTHRHTHTHTHTHTHSVRESKPTAINDSRGSQWKS